MTSFITIALPICSAILGIGGQAIEKSRVVGKQDVVIDDEALKRFNNTVTAKQLKQFDSEAPLFSVVGYLCLLGLPVYAALITLMWVYFSVRNAKIYDGFKHPLPEQRRHSYPTSAPRYGDIERACRYMGGMAFTLIPTIYILLKVKDLRDCAAPYADVNVISPESIHNLTRECSDANMHGGVVSFYFIGLFVYCFTAFWLRDFLTMLYDRYVAVSSARTPSANAVRSLGNQNLLSWIRAWLRGTRSDSTKLYCERLHMRNTWRNGIFFVVAFVIFYFPVKDAVNKDETLKNFPDYPPYALENHAFAHIKSLRIRQTLYVGMTISMMTLEFLGQTLVDIFIVDMYVSLEDGEQYGPSPRDRRHEAYEFGIIIGGLLLSFVIFFVHVRKEIGTWSKCLDANAGNLTIYFVFRAVRCAKKDIDTQYFIPQIVTSALVAAFVIIFYAFKWCLRRPESSRYDTFDLADRSTAIADAAADAAQVGNDGGEPDALDVAGVAAFAAASAVEAQAGSNSAAPSRPRLSPLSSSQSDGSNMGRSRTSKT
ncbi:MAG: hypothetical protein ABW189_02895 [Rickettsiales bacterium]